MTEPGEWKGLVTRSAAHVQDGRRQVRQMRNELLVEDEGAHLPLHRRVAALDECFA